ncbi:MAG: DUF4412 domain-containing protein, partial [Rhizobacter sp.]|nr:DUF4412 domain-containing protein [Chlorobiales bacterium]
MRKLIFSLAMLCCYAASAFAQFEGEIDMKTTSSQGGNGTSKIKVSKAGDFRIDASMTMPMKMGNAAEPMAMQMTMLKKKSAPDVMLMLNDKQKTYSEIDLKKMQEMSAKTAPEGYAVTKLGTEKILGYTCEHVKLTKSGSKSGVAEMEMWLAKDVASYELYMQMQGQQAGFAGTEMGKALKAAGVEGFPVKSIAGGGNYAVTTEITKIEKKSVPSSAFEIPAGYTKQAGGMGAAMEGQMTPEMRKQMKEMMEKAKQDAGKSG